MTLFSSAVASTLPASAAMFAGGAGGGAAMGSSLAVASSSTIFTASNIALAAAAVGTGMMAYGQYQEGVQRQKASEYNAMLADQQAGMIESQKQLEKQRYDRLKRQYAGKAKAAAGKSGVEYSGSILDTIIDSLTEIELDSQIEQYNLSIGKKKALDSASYNRSLGMDYGSSGKTAAATTLLTSGSELYRKYA